MATHARVYTGQALRPPKAVIDVYAREINRMVRDMIKDYQDLLKIYQDKSYQVAMDADNSWLVTEVQERLNKLGKQWADKFKEFAQKVSKSMILKVLRSSNLQIKTALRDYFAQKKWELIGDNIPVPMQQTMKAHVAENVNLITSIANQYHERITGSVYRAISGDGSFGELKRDFIKYGGMSSRRAKGIASDQVHKAFVTLSARRMASLGIEKVRWVHGHPKEPRPYHARHWDGRSGIKDGRPNGLDGYIFSLDNPPVVDEKTGVRALPSFLPFCSCSFEPVLAEFE